MTGRWALLLLAGPIPLAAQTVAYEGGLSGTTGRYFFDARTTSLAFSTGLALTAGRFTARLAVPLLAQNTQLVTTSGAGGMPSGGPLSGMVSDSGRRGGHHGRMSAPSAAVPGYAGVIGDPIAMLSARVVESRRGSVTAGVGVKAPVADTTSFGTGEWDMGATLGMTLRPSTRTFVGLDASYWHLGDLAALDFRDPLLGTVTAGRVFDGWSASVALTTGTSALRGYAAPASLSASFHRLSPRLLWGVTAAMGLTETVPEASLSVAWRVPLAPGAARSPRRSP